VSARHFPYGGEVVAQTLVTFVDAINGNVANGENAQLALSGTIPLLRGAGMVKPRAPDRSERQLVYAVRTFEDFRRQLPSMSRLNTSALIAQQKAVLNRRVNYANLLTLTQADRGPVRRRAASISSAASARSRRSYSPESDLVNSQASVPDGSR